MIVPMKKATIIVQTKDAESALASLRELGVLHIEYQQTPKGREITQLQDDVALINSTISVLSEKEFFKKIEHTKVSQRLTDFRFTARHIIDLRKRLDQLDEYSRNLIERISQWERWGDFEPQDIEALATKNVFIKFYQVPLKEINNLPSEVLVKKLYITGRIANCVIVSQEKIGLPYKEMILPKMGLSKMRARLVENKKVMQTIRNDICKFLSLKEKFQALKKNLENELEFHQAIKGMGEVEKLSYLTGYLPYDVARSLQEAAKKEKWALVIAEPASQDLVPTLIRNPRWVSLINPIFKVLNIVPGYNELDISLWFLIFLSIFFGIIIGDAGYGLVYLGLTLFFKKKFKDKVKDSSIFILFYLLSGCAIIWGLLSGTFFGQAWLPQAFKPLLPALRSDKNVQAFCFFMGAFHLSIAHLWRAILKLPSVMALADLGWISILWGGFFLARTLVLGENFPAFGKWFYIVGPILVIIFSNPSKNIIKGIGAGLGNFLLSFVNCFTDVVSYIRLFAVGLAGVAVADAFNKMALGIGFNSLFTGLLTSLILILGHLLNVVLGPMAVLVHGVRLNVLEFCGHTDIKWSGFAYKPLRKTVET